jgi:hypothetical protein
VIARDPSGQPMVDLVIWLERAALDVIGEGVDRLCSSHNINALTRLSWL